MNNGTCAHLEIVAGARASARFNVQDCETPEISTSLGTAALKRHQCRAPLAPASHGLRLVLLLAGLMWSAALPTAAGDASTISLAGQWRFELDRQDIGVAENWSARSLPGKIKLPGGLTEQGIGDAPSLATKWTGGLQDPNWFSTPEYAAYTNASDFKFPFWLTPDLYYSGAAWFQRDVKIPAAWAGQRVVLHLERAHWETRVWLDGRLLGTNNSLGTPHEYDLGQVAPGQHTLTLCVDNRTKAVDVGEDSHSVTEHTQGNWNGVIGAIELRATPTVWIESVRVLPNVAAKRATVSVQVGNATGKAGQGQLEITARLKSSNGKAKNKIPGVKQSVTWDANGGSGTLELELGADALTWSEFSPALYELIATLTPEGIAASERQVDFGLREIATQGTEFLINGQKTFFRGTLECAIFPKTGHPPTDVASWKRIITIAKAHGLNLIRFHSWCPPEAAFQAADELGVYFHVECSSWANGSSSLGDGKPIDQWIYDEADRILKAYGNHPSFVILLYGNEPGGKNHPAYLSKWVAHYKAREPRQLFSSGAGWPELPENQLHNTPKPRVQQWAEGLKSRINAKPPDTTTDYAKYISARKVPVISHEIGQWCVYPNFDEIKKYTGYLKPRNFEIFRDRLEASDLYPLAKSFFLASGKLQALCYKEDIESALRTPGMGGFELLDLHDFPGQGTALVGVLDPFWDEKGYITAKEFSRFCNATVPLAQLPKRVFTTDETLSAAIKVAHYGAQPLAATVTTWKLVDDRGKVFERGEFPAQDIPVGNDMTLGTVTVALQKAAAPARYKLVVGLQGTAFENDWDVWVYPTQVAETVSPEILVSDKFDGAAREKLHAGGTLLLTIPGKSVRNYEQDAVKLGFSSIFWNTAWTLRQAPTTLGILCDPKHPALAEFPTEFCSNWQWWYLVHRAGALRLDLLPRDVKPIVRVIDDWFTARTLGLVVEGKVGTGKIIVCGFDLTSDAADPVSQQMRRSLLAYAAGKGFAPTSQWTEANVVALFVPERCKVSASSSHEGYAAELAVDGDAKTFWHTDWNDGDKLPATFDLDLRQEQLLRGFNYTPRQDMARGRIARYTVEVSCDGKTWLPWQTEATFPNSTVKQSIRFAKPVQARYLRLTTLSDHGEANQAAIAELAPVAEEITEDVRKLGIVPGFNDKK